MRGRPTKGETKYIPLRSVSEAAREYGVSRNNLAENIRSGKIRAYVVKGHIYISAESIEDHNEAKEASNQGGRGPNFTAVLEGYSEGKSDYAIAKELGLTRERVRQIRSKVGLPVNPRRPTLPRSRYGFLLRD